MSTQYIGVYINFQGKAREAMEFYQSVLGGKLQLFAMEGAGFAEGARPRPAKPGESIVYARLEAEGMVIVASDGNPQYPPTVGDNVAIALEVNDEGRLEKIFDSLADGGTTKMPLTKYSWGSGSAGWLADKFGIVWSVSTSPG